MENISKQTEERLLPDELDLYHAAAVESTAYNQINPANFKRAEATLLAAAALLSDPGSEVDSAGYRAVDLCFAAVSDLYSKTKRG